MSDTPLTDENLWVGIHGCVKTSKTDGKGYIPESLSRDLERELNAAKALITELEARCKRLEEAARAVYLDSIASDHPWTELETRNMHALRDVLEAKP